MKEHGSDELVLWGWCHYGSLPVLPRPELARSLKMALLIVTPLFGMWGALHYFLGSRRIRADIRVGCP